MIDTQVLEQFPIRTRVRITLAGAKYLARVTGYKGRTKLRVSLLTRNPMLGQDIEIEASEVERVTSLPLAVLTTS